MFLAPDPHFGARGAHAPAAANLNLMVQLVMGLALLVGFFLARKKRFRAHGICQSAVVLLNLFPILSYMLPVFRRGVTPALPQSLGDAFYFVSTSHAVLGSAAEVLGLYIILRAGTNLLPEGLRFQNYKVWMRTELVLWWIVIALGISTYWVWYYATPNGAGPPAGISNGVAVSPRPETAPTKQEVAAGNFSFEPKELKVKAGTTVQWNDTAGRHTVTADDNSFKSGIMAPGQEFSHKFDSPGRYPYYCTLHGGPGGRDMAGVVIVGPGD